jgi:hypothetical protein
MSNKSTALVTYLVFAGNDNFMQYPFIDEPYKYDYAAPELPMDPETGLELQDFFHPPARRSNPSSENFETERLRAALQGTPGSLDGAFKDVLFQVGLTPASADDLALSSGRLGRRFTRRSRGSRLSERSLGHLSSKDGSSQLKDLLEEMQAEEDLVNALPTVGEGLEDNKQVGVTQYSLLEESGPSMEPSLSLATTELKQTCVVLQ